MRTRIFAGMNTMMKKTTQGLVFVLLVTLGSSTCTHASWNIANLFFDKNKTEKTIDNVNEVTGKLPDAVDGVVKGFDQSVTTLQNVTDTIVPSLQQSIDQVTRTTHAAQQLMNITTLLVVILIVYNFVLPFLQELGETFGTSVKKRRYKQME